MTGQPDDDPGTGGLFVKLDITLIEAAPDKVVASMPVAGNTQPMGFLHGGASIALAETVASLAATLHNQGQPTVGIEVSASHHRPARHGTVTATATPLRAGRQLATYAVTIHDDGDRLLSTIRVTCMTTSPAP